MPIKGKVHGTRVMWMVSSISDNRGLITVYRVRRSASITLWRPWLCSWGGSGWKCQNWSWASGISTGTIFLSALPPLFRTGGSPGISSFAPTRHFSLIWFPPTCPYCLSWKKSSEATPSRLWCSRRTGTGSPRGAPWRSTPSPSWRGWSCATSIFRSGVSMSKKVRK